MLTAKADELDKVLGLEMGADDYVTKPFSPRELVARIKAILRREKINVPVTGLKITDFLEVDLIKHEVLLNNAKVDLTQTEFKILKFLLAKRGWVFSRKQILDFIDIHGKGVLERTIDVHIKNLREKLGEGGDFIKNVWGIGYKFEE
jgi:DNA-binding response OmpR family regulator